MRVSSLASRQGNVNGVSRLTTIIIYPISAFLSMRNSIIPVDLVLDVREPHLPSRRTKVEGL